MKNTALTARQQQLITPDMLNYAKSLVCMQAHPLPEYLAVRQHPLRSDGGQDQGDQAPPHLLRQALPLQLLPAVRLDTAIWPEPLQ